ncbi:carbonic anhydrase [Kamptonema cortianum]|nr:carbonic anhydrase [Geitlerinema splendidum]MDK3156302.1 carbonic anhydrase [Kamptonema cortianum]
MVEYSDPDIRTLLLKNREWAAGQTESDSKFFSRLVSQQNPKYLWIGCSDSRVPANQIIGLEAGEVFVHRNIANIVSLTDMNCLSVIEYAVSTLNVEHVIVAGHYGCGGVKLAFEPCNSSLSSHWLESVRIIRRQYTEEISSLTSEKDRHMRLCELNVLGQMRNLAATSPVQAAWHNGFDLKVHGLIYALEDGILRPVSEPLTKDQ